MHQSKVEVALEMAIKLHSPKNAHYLQMEDVFLPKITQLAHQQYSVFVIIKIWLLV